MAIELNVASSQFNELVQDIRTLANAIRSECEQSSAHFKGVAATSFRQVMVNYDTNLGALNGSLQTMSNAISESARTFATTDDETSASIAQAASGLNM